MVQKSTFFTIAGRWGTAYASWCASDDEQAFLPQAAAGVEGLGGPSRGGSPGKSVMYYLSALEHIMAIQVTRRSTEGDST